MDLASALAQLALRLSNCPQTASLYGLLSHSMHCPIGMVVQKNIRGICFDIYFVGGHKGFTGVLFNQWRVVAVQFKDI